MAYNFADLFEHSVDAMPDRIALVEDGRRVTFAELDRRANQLAHHLATLGVGSGTHVGYQMHNSIETVETLIACFKLAAVPINVDCRRGVGELADLYADADLEVLIYHAGYGPRVRAALDLVGSVRHTLCVDDGFATAWPPAGTACYHRVVAEAPTRRPFTHRGGDDLVLIYTAGAEPKGVMWRQEDLWRAFGGGIDFCTGERVTDEYQQSRIAARTQPSTWFVLPPLTDAAAMMPTFAALWTGNAVMFTPRFDPAAIWRTVVRDRPQVLVLTGDAMVGPLVDSYRACPVDASSLVAIAAGTALHSEAGKAALLALFPHAVVAEAIGSADTDFGHVGFAQTEAGSAPEAKVRPGSGAIVVDEDGRRVPDGVEGWLAQTDAVPMGYYKGVVQSDTLFRTVDGVHVVITRHRARVADGGAIVVTGEAGRPDRMPPPREPSAGVSVVDAGYARPAHEVAVTVPARFAPFESAALREHVRRSAGYEPPAKIWVAEVIVSVPGPYRFANEYRTRRIADR
ncbi:AMP-binding protein [Nocardia bovistercoris]|uniref:AMP-binding protein n=1 Tax=Nocardia bovistercoris TaxID=2785916 RepID=A0A931N2B2_9NOCA|nr:AMP-binding protein [Nocardia bovistercoris]MBH0775328.1 AMP-binding protein [Nocardia bovistercoris]